MYDKIACLQLHGINYSNIEICTNIWNFAYVQKNYILQQNLIFSFFGWIL